MSTEITKQTKIVTQLWVVITCAFALFSAWVMYSKINSQVTRNSQDVQILYSLDKEKTEWRNQTENTITRIETKLTAIEKWIDEIVEFIQGD
jgi:hypothetical protein